MFLRKKQKRRGSFIYPKNTFHRPKNNSNIIIIIFILAKLFLLNCLKIILILHRQNTNKL